MSPKLQRALVGEPMNKQENAGAMSCMRKLAAVKKKRQMKKCVTREVCPVSHPGLMICCILLLLFSIVARCRYLSIVRWPLGVSGSCYVVSVPFVILWVSSRRCKAMTDGVDTHGGVASGCIPELFLSLLPDLNRATGASRTCCWCRSSRIQYHRSLSSQGRVWVWNERPSRVSR